MPTPAEIVNQHRQGLIRRLLNRNPLLHFRPPQKGKGVRRIDLYRLFAESGDVFEHDKQPELRARAKEFLQKIAAGQEGSVDFPPQQVKQFAAPLRRLMEDARERYRSTGQWSLVLAWPLIYVPLDKDRRGNDRAYYAPLLTWKINIRVRGRDRAEFFLREGEEGAEFNFMLQAWLEGAHELSLQWENGETECRDLGALAQRVQNLLEQQWNECEIPRGFAEGDVVSACPSEMSANQPVVIPCAVIGLADFRYRPLLADIDKLLQELGDGKNPGGLLGEVLTEPEYEREKSARAEEPSVQDRWLVTEHSDAMQEESVWQARREKVMLIKGPPGTGKSQTIVNLIADAARRRERVALVCQKKPALDVVQKRLAEVGSASIVAQIDEPKKDRTSFVKRIREIAADAGLVGAANARNEQCEKIDRAEEACAKMPDNEGLLHSVRGDLRAKIFRVHADTEFNAFALDSQIICDGFRLLLGDKITQDQSDDLCAKCENFAKMWCKIDYPNNPWYSVRSDWNEDENATLQSLCNELQKSFADLAKQSDDMPNELLVFAESPVMTGHFRHFFAGTQKEKVHNLCNLIADTKKLFEYSGCDVRPLWRELFIKSVRGNPFDAYLRAIPQIADVIHTRTQRESSQVWQLLERHFECRVSDWPDILLAIISRLRFDQLPFRRQRYESAVTELKEASNVKLKIDQQAISARFGDQITHQRQLQSHGLLRLRRSGDSRAPTLRHLYHRASEQIWGIFPVLLTSPDALCQVVPWESECIDTVIIDEASQMFTADSLPVLYRAKKIYVCGDGKQMPPSDFFASMFSESADMEDEEETDEMRGRAPADGQSELLDMIEQLLSSRGDAACRQLNVHYRSLPSELIAFSSHAFYDGRLQAAPNNAGLPECMKNPIDVKQIDGNFDNHVNDKEIDAVIEQLREIWSMPSPAPSVGVIVFNVTQAQKLLEQIDQKRDEDPNFSEAYDNAQQQQADGEDASFFVRSVEHVQGDERDIIILATTYDKNTKIYGPLSQREKGRRRLNVAITRAKKGVIVITSLPKNFSSHGHRPVGMGGRESWYFWMYMRYARAVSDGNQDAAKGILREIDPAYNPQPTGRDPDSEFEINVADFLRDSGFHVDYQIGESGFRIDLGVKKEATDPQYLCGVECDGRIWHSGWRARHNDIWRQAVLEEKGWNIIRIWSDVWFSDPNEAGRVLVGKIQELAAENY